MVVEAKNEPQKRGVIHRVFRLVQAYGLDLKFVEVFIPKVVFYIFYN